jgi:hypothetical protein
MSVKELRSNLLGQEAPASILDWLQGRFLPVLVGELNTLGARRRLGIYGGEKIPENERNLTDVRNRVSLIIEYETARIASQLLEDAGEEELFVSYVVANRFPDLEVRTVEGQRGLRFEVKCLQSIAEEKSANFDTLKKDIHPRTDFLLVYLWEWEYDSAEVAWDRAPRILKVFCFNAFAIAQLRDWYWLNQPPGDLGDGLQGFDLRYAVNCRNGRYNEEEGNYGKLLRIWTDQFPYQPDWTPLLKRTEQDYLVFKSHVVRAGFDTLSQRLLVNFAGAKEVAPITVEGAQVGWRAGASAFLLSARLGGKGRREGLFKDLGLKRVVLFSDKYAWAEYAVDADGAAVEVRRGTKPKQFISTAGPA